MSAFVAAAPHAGATSLGLTTTALPAASAGSASSSNSSTGKFHGDTMATTPCGARVTTQLPPFVSDALADSIRSSSASLSTAPETCTNAW
eukprot:2271368-Pleurochrysis_carterae.AAC.3